VVGWALSGSVSVLQKAACDEFLTAIKPFWKECPELSDHWCLKYLSVRSYKLEKAVPRYVRCQLANTLESDTPSSSADARRHRAHGVQSPWCAPNRNSERTRAERRGASK
jgi:hypothetical protein